MAKYYPITAEQMNDFLTNLGFIKLDNTKTPDLAFFNTKETVYSKRVEHPKFALALRVMTGIVGNESRPVGDDAIRVMLVMRANDGTIVKVSGDKRVHRVEGWRNNLKNRIEAWTEQLPTETCYKCGSPKVLRKGKDGRPDFMGCATYFLHDDYRGNHPQKGQQPAQNAPTATQTVPQGPRVLQRSTAVKTLTYFLENNATLDEIARMFSLNCSTDVVVNGPESTSQPHNNGIVVQRPQPKRQYDLDAESEVLEMESHHN